MGQNVSTVSHKNGIDFMVYTPPICRTFEWLDDKKGSSKKLGKTPAKQFIDTSLSQIHKQLEDETIFPTKFGKWIALARVHVTGCVCVLELYLSKPLVIVRIAFVCFVVVSSSTKACSV